MCLDFSKDELLQYNTWKLYIYHLIKRLVKTLAKSNIKRIAFESFIVNNKTKIIIIFVKNTLYWFHNNYIFESLVYWK